MQEIDQALAGYATRHRVRPAAVYLGERKLTQRILDSALRGQRPARSTAAGRPLAYRNLDLRCDEVNANGLRMI